MFTFVLISAKHKSLHVTNFKGKKCKKLQILYKSAHLSLYYIQSNASGYQGRLFFVCFYYSQPYRVPWIIFFKSNSCHWRWLYIPHIGARAYNCWKNQITWKACQERHVWNIYIKFHSYLSKTMECVGTITFYQPTNHSRGYLITLQILFVTEKWIKVKLAHKKIKKIIIYCWTAI